MNARDRSNSEPVANPFGLEAYRLHTAPEAEVVHMVLAPGQKVPAHRSPTTTLFVALSGEPVLEADGERHSLRPGQLLASPAGAAHGMENPSPRPAEILVIKAPRPEAPVEFVNPPPSSSRNR